MKLTFVTWNLLLGGIDAGSDARLRRQLAIVGRMGPAVAALQECWRWDRDYFRALHLAERVLGMRGFLAPLSAPSDLRLAHHFLVFPSGGEAGPRGVKVCVGTPMT